MDKLREWYISPFFSSPAFQKRSFNRLFPYFTVSTHYCFPALLLPCFSKTCFKSLFPHFTVCMLYCFPTGCFKILKKFCDDLFPDRPPPSNFTVSLLFKIFKEFSSVYFPTVCFLAFLFPNTIDLFLARPPPSNCFSKCSKSFPRSISPLFCFPTSTICFSTFLNIHLRSVSRPAAAKQLAASGAP